MPEPVRSPRCQPFSIGPTERAMAGMLTVVRAQQHGGRGLDAADGQHHAVERVAIKRLNEPR